MSKEMWFREFVRLEAEGLDEGLSEKQAYQRAADKAHGALTEKLADAADMARLREKERRS